MKLNEKISYYRREQKMSQEELAAQVGVSRQAVSKWELGEASPDIGKLLALAKAFGVTTDHLLNEDEKPERDTPALPSQEVSAPPPPPPPSQAEQFSNLPGFLGKMVRRWGWLAGIYLALQGAGLILFGLLGRFMVSGFFRGMGDMGGFRTGGGWTYSGPPELEEAIMGELGIVPQASPFSGIRSVMMAIPTLALVIGLVMVVGGLVLAYVLWKNGKKGD